ncbi:MAG: hypothetical protein QM715_15100 [Nibricoccus sp.]
MKPLLLTLFALLIASSAYSAEPTATTQVSSSATVGSTQSDYVLVHFILRQDESRNLTEIQQLMKDQKFWAEFPPEGIQVESWYVVMGLGHAVTLRVPPARLREVNLAMERAAWKIFRTECYPAYDLKKVAEANREKQKAETAAAKP